MPKNEMKIPPITPEVFSATYRDAIRVGLNWDRFFKESWPVEKVTLTTADSLKHCYMPWYFGKMGHEVGYDDLGACPINLTDVPKVVASFNEERRTDIQNYVDLFRDQPGIVEFGVPTYALPDNRYFVLDRNHRLSALALTPVKFSVTLWNVKGPLEPDCLLDLIHWVKTPENPNPCK